ncbi:bifunctional hydroxymethylpyrimidine kinase/phosphomethylpyrimidine kinase [Desulfosoma caldarium]|uniref:hydroxymethylpyrimidine kinase n=1 Tax=Desulfosoma caldarium TaxID=610254 RepID=A0A3N1UR24_9BACT|nr:bifunctional hydroxymethylpyrimidine kinase/phosphomethylpyrimidine kinase [Desulfosoma caldarium]ROQ93572.1 hydroxymethylpyrimidine kinase /phosphomethylpyrimidine kinase [Desulfosoma caldarium]
MKIPRALTIAGSDSGGGAGIQADLKTFSALGVFGMSAVTALTAQNTVGVRAVWEVDPAFVSAQIRAVVEDIGVDAVKTGMLATSAIIQQVSRDVRDLRLTRLVVDPVMVAKSGDALLHSDAVSALVEELLPLALVVTPNLHEAEALVGFPVRKVEDMEKAARKIKAFGPRYVVLKGGHLPGDPMDIMDDGETVRRFPTTRYDTPHTHGTGCTFASAIAAGLAKGLDVPSAVAEAKDYITGAIREALPLGKGHGPVHHFHALYRLAGWRFEP